MHLKSTNTIKEKIVGLKAANTLEYLIHLEREQKRVVQRSTSKDFSLFWERRLEDKSDSLLKEKKEFNHMCPSSDRFNKINYMSQWVSFFLIIIHL